MNYRKINLTVLEICWTETRNGPLNQIVDNLISTAFLAAVLAEGTYAVSVGRKRSEDDAAKSRREAIISTIDKTPGSYRELRGLGHISLI
jgi:hypothetical protein